MGEIPSSISPLVKIMWPVFCLFFASVLGISSSTPNTQVENFGKQVHSECGYTRYPALCMDTVIGLGLVHRHHDMLPALVEKIRDETKILASSSSIPSSQQVGLQSQYPYDSTIGYCVELMELSLKRLNQSLSALNGFRPNNKPDIQTWLSAVLTFQQSCKDAVQGLSDDLLLQIFSRMDHLTKLASNALAMANRISGHQGTNTGQRIRSGEIFPTWLYLRDRKLLHPTVGNANAVVAQDGSGHYKTIAEAMNAASGRRFVIYVKSGVYREKIHVKKDSVTLIGDGKYATVITGHGSLLGGSKTLAETATVVVSGDGFIARDIGFENTAGPGLHQALALYVESDHSVFYRCSMRGYQDTLQAVALRQFYRDCDIHGTVDFIFGNAAAVFQNCNFILRRPKRPGYNVILANGRSDPGQNTGFSVQNCKIMAGSDLAPVKHAVASYLGRPWKEYSRSVIMQSAIDDAIEMRGWIEWSGGFALKTLYFAEYLNSGPGAGTSRRVRWPGYHVIGPQEAVKFTVGQFIRGNSWLPSTGVMFNSGL